MRLAHGDPLTKGSSPWPPPRPAPAAAHDAPQAVIDTDDIAQLEAGRALVIQLLQEAQGAEAFGATTLQAHIAMTPASPYRRILERHLRETRDQSERLQRRLGELGVRRSLLASGVGAATTAVGTALALGKGPIDLLRGRAGEEKLFKNVKDEVTTEAQEIVTYEGIEAAAHAVGDVKTAELAASIRDEEQQRVRRPARAGPGPRRRRRPLARGGRLVVRPLQDGRRPGGRSVRDEAVGEAEELVDDARDASRDGREPHPLDGAQGDRDRSPHARSAEKSAARSTARAPRVVLAPRTARSRSRATTSSTRTRSTPSSPT